MLKKDFVLASMLMYVFLCKHTAILTLDFRIVKYAFYCLSLSTWYVFWSSTVQKKTADIIDLIY